MTTAGGSGPSPRASLAGASTAPPEHSNPPAEQAGSRWAVAAARYAPIAIPMAVMAVLGLWGLTRDNSMGNDEIASRWAALLSLRELAHLLRHVDAVHGLYYLLMHGWVVVGSSPVALRFPSVIAMTIGAGLIALLARRLTGSSVAALLAGLVMALTPTISFYAQTARSYAMVYACVAGATLALLHALERRTATRAWLGYAALVAVASYLNEMALLVLAAHAITVALAGPGRDVIRRWLVAAAGGAALLLPLLAVSALQHAAVGWIGTPGLGSLRILFHDYFGASVAVAVALLALAIFAALPQLPSERQADGEQVRPWWRPGGVSLQSVAVPLLVAPAFLLLAESVVGRPLYVDRYVLYGESGAALLAGYGAYRLGRLLAGRRRELIWAPGAVICAAALVLQLGAQQRDRTPQSRHYDFGGPARYIAARAQPGDGILYFDNFYRKLELGYPGDLRGVSDFGMAQSPMQAGTFRGTDKPFQVVQPLMLGYQRIWVVGLPPSPVLKTGLLRQESTALAEHFTLIASRHFRGMTVTLWQRR
jgi:mannosyltransferase